MMLRLRGFTLIELLIAVAIFVFLIMLAGPSLTSFMANSQIRNATDAMLNGVQQAQAAAVRRNTLARLLVDTTAVTGGWQVFQTFDGVESVIQIYTYQDGAPKTVVTPVPTDARQITFDGFGRIAPNVDASATLSCLKVTHKTMSSTTTRPLNVAITNTGTGIGTKLCDPGAASSEPQACPAGCN